MRPCALSDHDRHMLASRNNNDTLSPSMASGTLLAAPFGRSTPCPAHRPAAAGHWPAFVISLWRQHFEITSRLSFARSDKWRTASTLKPPVVSYAGSVLTTRAPSSSRALPAIQRGRRAGHALSARSRARNVADVCCRHFSAMPDRGWRILARCTGIGGGQLCAMHVLYMHFFRATARC